MRRPTNTEDYIELVKQALYEVDELRFAMEYDMESMGRAVPFIDKLEKSMHELEQSMREGTYRFEGKDLAYMSFINDVSDHVLPFKHLLKMINETHRLGLDVG